MACAIDRAANALATSVRKKIDKALKDAGKLMNLLLKEMKDSQASAKQWAADESYGRALEYQTRLITCVELLETFDCGSVGGYGDGQPEDQSLDERVEWLLKKYGRKVKP